MGTATMHRTTNITLALQIACSSAFAAHTALLANLKKGVAS
jgi:hypothetical protein